MVNARILLVLAGLLVAAAPALAGEVEARLDRTTVAPGETVQLLLRYRGSDARRPDLSVLEDDFEVLQVRQGQNVRIVNGQIDRSLDFVVTLAPRGEGTVAIPAVTMGDGRSDPLTLTVSDDPATVSRDVFIEVAVDDATPFVQGRVVYTIRLYDAVGILEGTLTPPELADGPVEKLGDDRVTETRRDGRPYRVIERRYALHPQSSGPVTIPPVVFQGRVRGGAALAGRDPFATAFGPGMIDQMLAPGRTVRVRSAPVTLEVQARPDQAGDGWFLPARNVSLADSWADGAPELAVGAAVTREITLTAEGVTAAQIPDLTIPPVPGLKQYPEVAAETEGGDGTVIQRQKITVIPTRPGTVTLPVIELDWWDSAAGVQRTARVPERTVTVTGTAPAATVSPTPASAPVAPPAASTPPAPASVVDPWWRSPWMWGSAVAVTLSLGALAAWINYRPPGGWRAVRRRADTPPGLDLNQAEKALAAACEAGDPGGAAAALAAWGRARWPDRPPAGPGAVADRLGAADLQGAVAALNDLLYGRRAGGAWNGAALWSAFRAARRQDRPRRAPALPDLYPDRG